MLFCVVVGCCACLLVALLLCFFAVSVLWSVARIFALLCLRLLAVLKCCWKCKGGYMGLWAVMISCMSFGADDFVLVLPVMILSWYCL